MEHLLLFTVVFWLSLLTVQCSSTTCGPVEEGTEITITCDNQSPYWMMFHYFLTWRADGFNDTVAICSGRDRFCVETYPGQFVASIQGYRGTLTIKNVSRIDPFDMETEWICEFSADNNDYQDNYTATACSQLEVYAKPEKPTCGSPVLNTTTFEVSLTCTTVRVYPLARCDPYMGMDAHGSRQSDESSVSYTHYELGRSPIYYKSECSIVVSLSWFAAHGSYFLVSMYPYVTEGSQFGVESSGYRLDIAKPDKPVCECDSLVMNSTTFEIAVTCFTHSFYSRVECAPYFGIDKKIYLQGPVSSVSYDHYKVSEAEGIYTSQCTLTVSLEELASPGYYYFKVKMFPGFTGGSNYGMDSDVMRLDSAKCPVDISSSVTKQATPENMLSVEEIVDGVSFAVTVTLGVLLGVTLCIAVALGVMALVQAKDS